MDRLACARQHLKGDQALLVCDPTNLFYFTGLEFSAGYLVITPTTADLYVDGRYLTVASAGPLPAHPHTELPERPYLVDSTTLTLKKGQGLSLTPVPHLLATLRAVKDPDELTALARAAELNDRGQDYVFSLLKPGITEREVSARLQIFWLENGGTRPSFDPIVAFGPNSAFPHHRPSDRVLEANDIALIDTGVELDHYQSDATRTHIIGAPASELTKIKAIVADAQAAALEQVRPGTPAGHIDAAARTHIESHGYTLPHSTGHGLGLEVHELPSLRHDNSTPLAEGMVITIEPAIYLPGLGGVRLEVAVCVTASGWRGTTIS